MKTVTVSRKTHNATFSRCKNLGQLIATIEKEGERDKLFVVKVYLNGKSMDSEEENLLDGLSINEVDELSIEFCTIDEIVRQSITDIIASIQNTQVLAIKFAKEFRVNEAIDDEKVKFILIQCRTVIESLEEVFKVNSQDQFLIKHLALWHQAEKELTNILQCILQSRKISKVEFLSDLIEYDLIQALDQWEEALEKELIDNPAFTGIFKLKSTSDNVDNGVDV